MWKLVIEDDEGKRTVVPLTRDDYTIGRQEGNTIRLTERNVSRTHGRVRRNRAASGNGHVFLLEDMRSYNGLFVNGLRVAHTQDLQNGDLIQIGDYRIVLQDDAANQTLENATIPMMSPDPGDAKATIPVASAYRGQTLTDRPNRLVMLVGPTPGVEYPLDRERMTIGRAEDASISVNHNSVSRLHCEVHALGDGRFEIVDKGSSNGVRVNAVELRRSIVEPGDVIELGDVRFKFVGAGQVFVPGPNESQQLTAISDREVDLVVSANQRRGLGAYAVPVIGALVVGAGVLVAALVWTRHTPPVDLGSDASITSASDTDALTVADAKAKCLPGDCDASRQALMTIPDASPWASSADYKSVVASWADGLLMKAKNEPDPAAKTVLLQKVLSDPKVDPVRKQAANDLLPKTGDTVPTPSSSVAMPAPSDSTATAPTPSAVVVNTPPATNGTAPTPPAAPTHHPNPPTTAKPPTQSVTEQARVALLSGDPKTTKALLLPRFRNGTATGEEMGFLKAACKGPPADKACLDEINRK